MDIFFYKNNLFTLFSEFMDLLHVCLKNDLIVLFLEKNKTTLLFLNVLNFTRFILNIRTDYAS